MSFARLLIMNRWHPVPEATALHALWHDAGVLRRAVKGKQYVDAEEPARRHERVRVVEKTQPNLGRMTHGERRKRQQKHLLTPRSSLAKVDDVPP